MGLFESDEMDASYADPEFEERWRKRAEFAKSVVEIAREDMAAEEAAPKTVSPQKPDKPTKTKSKLRFLGIFIFVIAVIFLVGMISFVVDAYVNGIAIPIAPEAIDQTECELLESRLKEAGFLRIDAISMNDLDYDSLDKDNYVAKIDVNHKPFKPDSRYSRFSLIQLYYHTPSYAYTPLSSKDAKQMDYSEVEEKFRGAGFGDIEIVHDYTLIFDAFDRYGTIETISVNNKRRFNQNAQFCVNDSVKIIIYDNRKNKPVE